MFRLFSKSRHPRACLLLPLLLSIAVLPACASLPDIHYVSTPLNDEKTPTVVNASGNLPERQAQSLLAKRLRASGHEVSGLALLEEAATGRPLVAGNKVTLLFDGPQTMKAMTAAIKSATDHINLETYIFDQDELGLRFADLLMEKQRAGVKVNILYDSVGTMGTPPEFFARMRTAGISLTEFNPVNPLNPVGRWNLNNRDHRKILVVDGRIGFTGGVNITKEYASSSLFRSGRRASSELGWRDTHLQIEGPAVASLQWLFLDTWVKQRNDNPVDGNYFPRLQEVGDKLVRTIATEPGADYAVYKAYALAMQQAKQSIRITVAYFAPDEQITQALVLAAQRGVEVQMVFPSVSDGALIFHAGRSFYTELLEAGVRIFEFQESVLHAKTAVIDGVWSTVGSANLDMRSFLHNTEVNVIVIGAEFGNSMESAFREDLKHSQEIVLADWKRRPLSDRIKEWAARRLAYWL